MGWGDDLMATGDARKDYDQHQIKVALGNGGRIRWSSIFEHNPILATKGDLQKGLQVRWVHNYKGHRPYHNNEEMIRQGLKTSKEKWLFSNNYKATPGEIYFSNEELEFSERVTLGCKNFIIIEPRTKHSGMGANKRYHKWQEVVNELNKDTAIVQLQFDRSKGSHVEGEYLKGVTHIHTPTFRHACAILSKAKAFASSEGGLHHAGAALRKPGVVIFGGFTPPQLTGYDFHSNIYDNRTGSPCGMRTPCNHCKDCMDLIHPGTIVEEMERCLNLSVPRHMPK